MTSVLYAGPETGGASAPSQEIVRMDRGAKPLVYGKRTVEGSLDVPLAYFNEEMGGDLAASFTIENTVDGVTHRWTGIRPRLDGDRVFFDCPAQEVSA